MSLAHCSPRKWRNLSDSAKSSAKRRKISSHNVMYYMKHWRLACALRKLPPQSKNSSCRWCGDRKQVIHAPEMQRVFLFLQPLNNADKIDHAAHRKRESRRHVT